MMVINWEKEQVRDHWTALQQNVLKQLKEQTLTSEMKAKKEGFLEGYKTALKIFCNV